MRELLWGMVLGLCLVHQVPATSSPNEHKVPYIHNIVLYPDKHSWCKTTEIKQIVAFPGCSSVEIDNSVCVGACFSYSIPKTSPSAPGEVITPYCDSCQPAHYTWKEVKLTCRGDSDEDEDGMVELTKKVQVITNCTCSSCHQQKMTSEHQKLIVSNKEDVPELMSLMHMKANESRDNEEYDGDEDGKTEASSQHVTLHFPQETLDQENAIDVDDEKEKESKLIDEDDGENKLDIVHVNHTPHSESSHLVVGPHHTLVVKPDVVPEHHAAQIRHHKNDNDASEEVPSLLENQFKVHDNEEYLDQLAVESRKEFDDKPAVVYTLPELIYSSTVNVTKQDEKAEDERTPEENRSHTDGSGHRHGRHHSSVSHKGVKVVEVSHHHLIPAEEGVELSYDVEKPENKNE